MSLPNRDDRINRYVRGELTAAEARELAQESLDDPELFEELTHSALAADAVWGRGPRSVSGSRLRIASFSRPKRYLMMGALAAAVIVAVSVGILYHSPNPASAPAASLQPTLELARSAQQPVLLAADLSNFRAAQPEIFRGAESEPRPPRGSGTVLRIESAMATIDVGSNDGLSNGAVVNVYHGADAQREAGRIRISAVFRDRARGAIEGLVRAHDHVRIPVEFQFAARLDQLHAVVLRNDTVAAKKAAEDVVQWAASAHVPDSAQVSVWNTLAVLRILEADRAGAEALLRRALAACPPSDPAYPQILNNLGVLAELSGDRRKAADQYRSAGHALSSADSGIQTQEKVVESNLARVAR